LPFALNEPSVRPWKPWSAEMTRVRFVAARPSLIAASFDDVRAVGARPRAVEADRAQDAHELRIDRRRPELVLVARVRDRATHIHAEERS
jgi:hypothetical protein